jgi:type I restriction enzyme M protein
MLNAETKRHIDAARDVLVGVAPNPMTQIDQITYALIYKFMDDMDQAAIKAGGEPSFFVGELEAYSWSKLVDARMGNQEKMNLYGDALQKFSEAKQLPELFRTIFRAAFLPYRSPETLGLFLKEINHFDYSHPEELGNAYEYLLSIMSAQGDAGQFRTPRHIIDFMVEVMNPTKDDKVLDPACGTGGFLVSSYNHILEQHDGKDDPNKKEKPLTPDERKKLIANFEGYDIDPSMVRIAQVNMYLHQFKNPKIFQYDSLTSEERWNDKFDVILANPPFMSPKGGIKPHNKFAIQSNRSEVLFVDYIANHLKPNGRAAIIVPEGIIFQSGKAYKQLRKELVEGGLYSVISLPSGVFNPYSGVKTSILLLNNEIAKKSDQILFIKISNDGYDLGATKRPIDKNDLPEALKLLVDWVKGGFLPSEIAHSVSREKIFENTDLSLSGDRYLDGIDYSGAIWPLVPLEEVATLIGGGTPSRKEADCWNGEIPWLTASNIGLNGEIEGFEGITKKGLESSSSQLIPQESSILVTRVSVGKFAYVRNGSVALNQDLTGLVPKREKMHPRFLFHLVRKLALDVQRDAVGVGVRGVTRKYVSDLQIPLPPLNVQEQIAAELDGYSEIIEGANKIISNWKPRIESGPDWEQRSLGELIVLNFGERITKKDDSGSKYPVYGGGGESFRTDFSNRSNKFVVSRFAMSLACVRFVAGDFWLLDSGGSVSVKSGMEKVILEDFAGFMLMGMQPQIYGCSRGGAQRNLNPDELYELLVKIPDLETQKKIVQVIQKHFFSSTKALKNAGFH